MEYSFSSSSSSIDSSFSSSSSSLDDSTLFVTVYDGTNSQFKIYGLTEIWSQLTQINCAVTDLSTVRVDMCGRKIGIAYVDDESVIKYNFFDVDYLQWSFASFQDMTSSQLYGNIVDMDFSGYNIEDTGVMGFGWLSGTDDYSYVNSVAVDSDGTENPSGIMGNIIEQNSVDVVSQDYISNGYSKIATTLDSSNLLRIIVGGSAWKLYILSGGLFWTTNIFASEFTADALVSSAIEVAYQSLSDTVSMALSNSSDIYYLEQSSEVISASSPSIAILNDKTMIVADFTDGSLSGVQITGVSNNELGSLLGESKVRLLITSNKT